MGILRFVDVRTDAGSRSADLIADDRFVLIFEKFDKIEYFNGESNRYVDKFVVRFLRGRDSFRPVIYCCRREIASPDSLFSFFHNTRRKPSASWRNEVEPLHIAERGSGAMLHLSRQSFFMKQRFAL